MAKNDVQSFFECVVYWAASNWNGCGPACRFPLSHPTRRLIPHRREFLVGFFELFLIAGGESTLAEFDDDLLQLACTCFRCQVLQSPSTRNRTFPD